MAKDSMPMPKDPRAQQAQREMTAEEKTEAARQMANAKPSVEQIPPKGPPRLVAASLNGVVNIPKLGQFQTLVVEKNGKPDRIFEHPRGIGVHVRGDGDDFYVIPSANVAYEKWTTKPAEPEPEAK